MAIFSSGNAVADGVRKGPTFHPLLPDGFWACGGHAFKAFTVLMPTTPDRRLITQDLLGEIGPGMLNHDLGRHWQRLPLHGEIMLVIGLFELRSGELNFVTVRFSPEQRGALLIESEDGVTVLGEGEQEVFHFEVEGCQSGIQVQNPTDAVFRTSDLLYAFTFKALR